MKRMRSYGLILMVMNILTGIFVSYAYSEKETLIIDTEVSCVTAECHADMGKKKYTHGVGVDGKHCIKCHRVLKKGEHTFKLPENALEICSQCHSGKYIAPTDLEGSPPKIIAASDVFEEGERSQFHAPFAEGKCTECHDSHESDNYLHLKAEYPEGFYEIFSIKSYGLCLKCHKELEKALTEPRTLTSTMFRNGNLNLHFRHVNRKKGRTCKACHHPHGTENQKLIKDDFLFGMRKLSINYKKTETGGSCGPTCHIPLKYDRYEPAEIMMMTTPRPGTDADIEELNESRQRDMEKKNMKKEESETEIIEDGERREQ